MSRGGSIAFATEELYPFTPGGIGRLIHHLVRQALSERASKIHLFVPASLRLTQHQVSATFGLNVTVSSFEAPGTAALPRSIALAEHIARSCEHEAFEWIELPDFRGLGFATLHRAATRGLHGSPRLRVRLHGPNSLVSWHENQRIDAGRASEFDLERSSLLLADEVIAPMAPVRDAIATFFRLDHHWRARVRLSLPPRTSGGVTRLAASQPIERIIFPTKAQGIKRPDLFVAGVAELMRRRPRWTGMATLAAHRNAGLEESLFHALPPELRARFEWVSWSDAERARRFAGQVVVIPSDFETLSLAAWEAAAAGARIVASTRCPAFSEASPWTGWSGFSGFDGGVKGLADALGRALDSAAPPPLEVPSSEFVWAAPTAALSRSRPVSPEEITILVGGLETWTEQLSQTSTPWVMLMRAHDEVEAEPFRIASAAALSRREGAEVVSAAGPEVSSPTQAWAPKHARSGPLVTSTELALRVISPSSGRRALVASAIQLGLECLCLFVPTSDSGADDEQFPPLYLDAHPMALRAQRDGGAPLKEQVIQSARTRLSRLLRRR